MRYIKLYDNWTIDSPSDFKSEEIKTFEIGKHRVDVSILEIEEGRIKFDFMVDNSYSKISNLDIREVIRLYAKLREILKDYVSEHSPDEITFLPYDQNEKSIEKKDKINSLIDLPGYDSRKIGISTVFTKKGFIEE